MSQEAVFEVIDQATWPRASIFYYYTQMAPTSYTVTVKLEVTTLRKALKEKGYKFFPAYLYLVTKAIGKQQELRIAKKEGVVGAWKQLTPAYPEFHEGSKTTSLLWTTYQECFDDFYEAYMKDKALYGESEGILSAKGVPPENAYIISCIPWFSFESFSLHNHGIKDYFVPSLEAGAFIEDKGQILMPLSITVHHAATDGYHLKVFFEELQHSMNYPEEWLK